MNERLHTSLKIRRLALPEPGYVYVQKSRIRCVIPSFAMLLVIHGIVDAYASLAPMS